MSFPVTSLSLIAEPIIRAALAEDLGRAGDITTDSVVPPDAMATVRLASRKDGRLSGLDCALTAFRLLDPAITCRIERHDGEDVAAGGVIATIHGRARALLTAERTALNIMSRLSGIATATRALVQAVEGTNARIVCTRKTTPGLRALEKRAVRHGGGLNHRFGLDDAVLIKDNHIAIAGGIRPAMERARAHIGHMVKIEIEVDRLDQFDELLSLPPELSADVVLLDNMDIDTLRVAVEKARGRLVTEASGTVTLERVRQIAETGVDMISCGWLTHSAPILDIGLDI